LAKNDPEGSYFCVVDETHATGRQFNNHYIATSTAKKTWLHTRKVFAIDATFLTGPLRGYLYLAVTKDANNQLVLLAQGQGHYESGTTWRTFVRRLYSDFPGIKVVMSDHQKGLQSIQEIDDINDNVGAWSRCSKHLIGNAEDNCGSVPDEVRMLMWGMAKAGTKNHYRACYRAIKAKGYDDIANWMDERREQYATAFFLARNVKRNGDSTSNMVEQFNAIIKSKEFGDLPIIRLSQALISYSSQQCWLKREKAMKLADAGQTVTPVALDKVAERLQESSSYEVIILEIGANKVSAEVTIRTSGGPLTHRIVLDQRVSDGKNVGSYACQCGICREWGIPCRLVVSVFGGIRSSGSVHSHLWDHTDKKWFSSVWHVSTYVKQFQSSSHPKTGDIVLDKPVTLLPPPMKKKVGRKKKKKRKAVRKWDAKKVVTCPACGTEGHLAATCENPSSELLVNSVSTHKYHNAFDIDLVEQEKSGEKVLDLVDSDEEDDVNEQMKEIRRVLKKQKNKNRRGKITFSLDLKK
jgi:hypothetical protein